MYENCLYLFNLSIQTSSTKIALSQNDALAQYFSLYGLVISRDFDLCHSFNFFHIVTKNSGISEMQQAKVNGN
jgi:hypothetical protein